MSNCVKWGSAGFLWKNANWLWSACGPTTVTTSSFVQPPGVDATTLVQPWIEEPWNPYRAGEQKKKRLIKLICMIKGEKYDVEKEWKNFKITVVDIKLVVDTYSNVDLDVKLEE